MTESEQSKNKSIDSTGLAAILSCWNNMDEYLSSSQDRWQEEQQQWGVTQQVYQQQIGTLVDNLQQDKKEIKAKLDYLEEKYEKVKDTYADLREERGALRAENKSLQQQLVQATNWLQYRAAAYVILFIGSGLAPVIQTCLSLIWAIAVLLLFAFGSIVLFTFSWRGAKHTQDAYKE
jgi:hypothetical protein